MDSAAVEALRQENARLRERLTTLERLILELAAVAVNPNRVK